MPTPITWSEHLKIYCCVIVTQERPRVQQSSNKFRNLPQQAKERKNLPFHHFKKICAIIGYRSTKYFVSFSKVPLKLRKLNQHNIVLCIKLEHLLNQYWWTFVLIFWWSCLYVSSIFCYLASFWEYRLENLRVFLISQLQAWECFQVFTNGVCFLLHRTRFLQ